MSPRRIRPRKRLTSSSGAPVCQACGQRITFVKMDLTGKPVPVDPIPVADGNVCGRLVGAKLHGYVISKDKPASPAYTRFAAHFGTCPSRPREMRTIAEKRAGRYTERATTQPTLFGEET